MRPILHLVGARPQFVKVAAVLRAAQTSARHRLVHTGQHFDAAMSDVFFAELGIRAPDWHLGVGGGSHAAHQQLAGTTHHKDVLKSPASTSAS